ncbi:MAG: phosphoribosyltransferase [Pedosphaera sp.]|nr:phosphoribosyltransferase [Pedosphaera sp.]
MTFSSREDAGQELGDHLLARGIKVDLVLGLPRGGVVVAAEVARVLRRPLDVLIVRKIGHPRQREFALGALAENDVVVLDRLAMRENRVIPSDVTEIIAEETAHLRDYQAKFHPSGDNPLTGKTVLIVDDGLATGSSAEAAARSAKKKMAGKVILATPVASPSAVDRLSAVADEVISLIIDPGFFAVGQYYDSFPQTTDDEVLALLHIHV